MRIEPAEIGDAPVVFMEHRARRPGRGAMPGTGKEIVSNFFENPRRLWRWAAASSCCVIENHTDRQGEGG